MVVLTTSTLCNGEGVKNLYVNEFYKTLKPFFNTVSFNTLIPIFHILENFFTVPQVDDYRNYLIKNDYISILINSIKKYIDQESFLVAAFPVLALIVRTLEGCSTFIALRGVPLITDLVRNHHNNESLCASGLRVLASCSLDNSSFKELDAKGIIEIVLEHIDTARPELLAVLMEIVKNMTSDEIYGKKMEDANVIPHFYGVIKRYPEEEEVIEYIYVKETESK